MKLSVSHEILLTLNFLLVSGVDDHISQLITNAGYSPEIHNTETEDGFILTLHRLKHEGAQPIFLMHGIAQSASVWVYDGPGRSLPFLLFDAGYDVWMLSARGTAVSSKHKTLTPDLEEYWDFTFHEIGFYDLPAAVDYILGNTTYAQVHYVGHSQGGTVFLVFLAMRPEYNEKVRSAYLLAPASFMTHVSTIINPIIELCYNNREEFTEAVRRIGLYSLSLRNPLVTDVSAAFCQVMWIPCSFAFTLILGADSGQLNSQTIVYNLAKYTADNISIKQFWHFFQLMFTDKFLLYDTIVKNQETYGSNVIPEYNLTNLNIPITIFYGTTDILVNWTDVETLISHVRTIKNTVKLPWSHMDFVSGKDAPTLIFQPILTDLESFRVTTTTTAPVEEFRRNQNIFEWIMDLIRKIFRN